MFALKSVESQGSLRRSGAELSFYTSFARSAIRTTGFTTSPQLVQGLGTTWAHMPGPGVSSGELG